MRNFTFVNVPGRQGLWDDVVIVQSSDFGRSVASNSNGGTDHGAYPALCMNTSHSYSANIFFTLIFAFDEFSMAIWQPGADTISCWEGPFAERRYTAVTQNI